MGKNKNKKTKSSKNLEEVQQKVDVEDSVPEEVVSSEVSVTKKTKKVVLFSEEWEQLESLREEESTLRSEELALVKEHEAKLKELHSKLKKNRKEQNTIFSKIPSVHNNEVKQASKEKRKRNGKNTGGFNKPLPVPQVLAKYLDIGSDELLSRPEVMHRLNEKFKEEGLKEGQQTVLDKKNSKLLNRPNGYTISFQQGQKFLASFYKSESVDV